MSEKASGARALTARGKAAARAAKGPRKPAVMYTEEKGQEICERLAAGERWRDMANTKGMPGYSVPYNWAKQHPAFGRQWVYARRIGADMRADEALTIAETATKETLPVDRFHVGTLKWHVDRDAKLYGPRKDEPDLGAGRTFVIRVRQFERYVDEDGVSRVREIEALPPVTSGPDA